ncbi:MAG: CDP-alcohol phosphatidyltransferase family protein [Candidatus Woesearchaeota archaeon]
MAFFEKIDMSMLRLIRFTARNLAKPIAKMGITANQVTYFRVLLLFISMYFYSTGQIKYIFLGSLFFLVEEILDYVDGEVARLTNSASLFGEWLDKSFDFIVGNVFGPVGFFIVLGIYRMTSNVWVFLPLIMVLAGEHVRYALRFEFKEIAKKGIVVNEVEKEKKKQSRIAQFVFMVMRWQPYFIFIGVLTLPLTNSKEILFNGVFWAYILLVIVEWIMIFGILLIQYRNLKETPAG